MALTVVFSLIASLLAALFFIPMLASRDFSDSGPSLTGEFTRHAFLQFPRSPTESPWMQHVKDLCWSLGLLVLRILRGVLVVVACALKIVGALGALVLLPFMHLFDRFRPAKRSVWSSIENWFSRDTFGPLSGEHIWPGLLEVAALRDLNTAFKTFANWASAGRNALLKVVRVILVPVVLVFFLVRFVFALIVAVLRLLLQTVAMILTAIILVTLRLFAIALAPVVMPLVNVINSMFNALQHAYPIVLRAALRQSWTVIVCAVAAFGLSWFIVLPQLGRELIPQVRQGEFNLDIILPIGTPLERTYEVGTIIESKVLTDPAVALVALTAGAENNATSVSEAGEHTARITVRLHPGLGAAEEDAVIGRVRREFYDFPELKMEVSYPALFSFKSPIEVEIHGYNLDTLKSLSQAAETRLAGIPGLVDVRSSLQSGNPEIRIIYNRDRLSEYGLSLRNVAELVRNKVQGSIATEYRQAERLIDIMVRLEENDRLGLAELSGLIVNPRGAIPIRLSAVAELQVNEGPSEIRRIDQTRSAVIYANLDGADLGAVSQDIAVAMQELDYPLGFSYSISGQNEEMQTSINSLIMAFALALFLVYIVMASQFESMVQPFLIMMTVPLALIGVIAALFVTGTSLSIMVFIGLIILAGIVVNNAIVLIDYINTLQDRGVEKSVAIVEAGRARLRPILMTTLTTVLGLAPMALGLGEGAEIRTPMALTVIAGLSVSMVLTLIVIPVLYSQFTRARQIEPESELAPEAPVPVA
jgi:HAE1 family hydrophobic/amphiphilic exporter-1